MENEGEQQLGMDFKILISFIGYTTYTMSRSSILVVIAILCCLAYLAYAMQKPTKEGKQPYIGSSLQQS